MEHRVSFILCLVLLFFMAAAGHENPACAENSGFGGGIHYNVTSGDISDTGFDTNYFSYVVSFRQRIRPNLRAELSLDYFPGRKEIDRVIRPFATLLWGDLINAGIGVTRSYMSRDEGSGEWSDFSYQLQGGVGLPLGADRKLYVDAFYFLQKFDEIRDIDARNITFAARLFFMF